LVISIKCIILEYLLLVVAADGEAKAGLGVGEVVVEAGQARGVRVFVLK
jgi:hypothetical protein